MFEFAVGMPMNVSYAGNYKTKEGTTASYIICRECDNQNDREKPSNNKFPVKFFMDGELPKGVVNGGQVVFKTILGGAIRHMPATDKRGNTLVDRYGNPYYNDELVLLVTELEGYPPTGDKKNTKK